MRLQKPIGFDWDLGNKEKNWLEHKVKFTECEQVFFDEKVTFFEDVGHSEAEERFLAYGETGEGRKLTIVFTIRKQKVRVISARDQSKKERKIYEQT